MHSAGSHRPLPCKDELLSPSLSSAPQILQFFQCDSDSNQHPETETKPSSAADMHLETRFPGLEPRGGREAAGLREQCRPESWGQLTRAQPCWDRQRPDVRLTLRTSGARSLLSAARPRHPGGCPALACGSSGPRTVQSEETEIPSLVKERKLKTKCFFLKSRKEAESDGRERQTVARH